MQDPAAVARFQFTGQNIPKRLEHWAALHPDKPLLIWEPKDGPGTTWTYGEFVREVRRLGAGMAARGVKQGDKVVIHCDNCPEMVIAWYACAAIGAVGVTTNTRSVADEMAYFIEHTEAVAAITQPQFAALVTSCGPSLAWVAVTADDCGVPATADLGGLDLVPLAELAGDEDACPAGPSDPLAPAGIMFTSGTTSRPKAVVHTHANALWAARVGPTNISMRPDGVYVIFLPFFHVNAQSWSMWTTVLGCGATVVLQPKFSASRFWEVIAKYDVTHTSVLPIVFNTVAGKEIPPNKLEVGVFGLIAPPIEQMLKCRIVPAYGMTETVTHATSALPFEFIPPGSMGRPTPGYEMLVVDTDTGEILEDGRVGELWVRGTRGIQLFLEYYRNPDANASSFTDDGWFKTGDRVRMGEGGAIFFSERDKDVLKVGGENVSAKEVEDVCRRVAGIADVAVVGRSHPMLDTVPVAFVIRRGDAAADEVTMEREILEVTRANLSDFKAPRAVYFVDDFPRATLDKIAKNKLRDQAEAMPAPPDYRAKR